MDNKEKVKKTGGNPNAATQTHLRIAEIKDDILVLKNGGVRAVLECGSINFNLKSEHEQEAIIASYRSFLNTIDFPVQIVIDSKKVDLDDYLNRLKQKADAQTNELLKNQTLEYIDYISRLLDYVDIMDKKFYVVVPFETFTSKKVSIFTRFLERFRQGDTRSAFMSRLKQFDNLKNGLDARVETVINSLGNCGLEVSRLNTRELIEYFYEAYNPEISRNESLNDENIENLS